MKLAYLFLFALSTLLLGYFSFGMLQHPTGNAVSSVYSDYVSFTVQPDHGLPIGEGSETLQLPGKVKSCTFTGTWITDNNQKFNQRNSCHNAKGTFSGSADAYQQYVINDPDLFNWADLYQPQLNPPATTYQDYSFWMELCDSEYYSPRHTPRYLATARLSGFGTNTLQFYWSYEDHDMKPQILFMIDLKCKLSSP